MTELNLTTKKLKTEDEEYQFFHDFLYEKKNIKVRRCLQLLTANELRFGNPSSMVFLEVTEANATSPLKFTSAIVDVQMIHDEESNLLVFVPLALFFLRGLHILKEFFNPVDPKIPKDILSRRALRDLLQFITSDQSVFLERTRGNEALRYAQHLMMSLVQQKTFMIDHHYKHLELLHHQCCSVAHPMDGKVGNTTFGIAKGWHGHTDILITAKDIPVRVIETQTDTDVTSISSDSSVDMKNDMFSQFPASDHAQMLAQTIVFSFLQGRLNESEHCLVPGVGIGLDKLFIFLYDSKEDVLLQSLPLNLFCQQGIAVLNCHAVCILWLVLNYEMFCTGVPDRYKCYKAKFHESLGPDYLQIYKKDVEKHLCERDNDESKEFFNLDMVPTVHCVDPYAFLTETSDSLSLEEALKQPSATAASSVQ